MYVLSELLLLHTARRLTGVTTENPDYRNSSRWDVRRGH